MTPKTERAEIATKPSPMPWPRICRLPSRITQGPHAFDVLHDSETSCEIVRQILAFLRLHLLA
jgi:hypothetical protein